MPYTFIGGTGLYDEFLYWVCYESPIKPPPAIFLLVWEGMFALLSVGILITHTI